MGKYAQSYYPFEACGLISKQFSFLPSKNISNRPRNSFMIDPVLVAKNHDNIWGIFHSHPDDRFDTPSEQDLKLTVYNNLRFILFVKNTFYIYWYDINSKMKRFEIFNESHCVNY